MTSKAIEFIRSGRFSVHQRDACPAGWSTRDEIVFARSRTARYRVRPASPSDRCPEAANRGVDIELLDPLHQLLQLRTVAGAPAWLNTSLPFLKAISVGMERMSAAAASSCCASVVDFHVRDVRMLLR